MQNLTIFVLFVERQCTILGIDFKNNCVNWFYCDSLWSPVTYGSAIPIHHQ